MDIGDSSSRKIYIRDNRELLLKKYRGLLRTYSLSCKKILATSEIPYTYYVRHIKKLIVLLHFIHHIYLITFKKNMPQINMFDKRTKMRYDDAEKNHDIISYFSVPITIRETIVTTFINDEYMLPIAYYNSNLPEDAKYILRFSHSSSHSVEDRMVGGDYSDPDKKLLYSTILHRSIRLSFVGSKIFFNMEKGRKYTDSLIDSLEYAKYMSILPSHISLNTKLEDNDREVDDVIPLFGDSLCDILRMINKMHSGFQETYDILHDNKGYETQYEEIKGYCGDDTIKAILYTINNNNNNTDTITKYGGSDRDYYYWFKYDSLLPTKTILDTYTYLEKIHTFQPFNITPTKHTYICEYYKGKYPHFSKVVNDSLQNYIANGIIMEKDAFVRVRYLLNFCSNARANTGHNKKPIYVFHGTHRDFTSHNKELVLTSFLSCSFNIDVAMTYAYENLKNKGIVYIIEVTGDIMYINFDDNMKQIILLPGLKIKVTNVLYIGGVKYNFCKVYNINEEYMVILYNNIFEGGGGKSKLYKIKEFKIHEEKSSYPQAVNIDIKKGIGDTDVSSYTFLCLGTQIGDHIKVNTYFNIKYTLHQHFISDCYKFFNINAVEYGLYYDSRTFSTGYKNDSKYVAIRERSSIYGRLMYPFKNLFVDSLLHNDDAIHPQKYMKHRFDYKISSFGNVGLFDYEGYKKLNIDTSKPSLLYMNIILLYKSLNLDRDDLFIRDITRDYMKIIISDNIGELKTFRDTFVDSLRANYIDFIERNMRISITTEEYKDLIDMLNELTEYLRITADYYVVNMENGNIYSEIEPHIYDKDMKVGGKKMPYKKLMYIEGKYMKDKETAKHIMTKDTVNDNKGYAMSYEDFLKVIEKYKRNNKNEEKKRYP